MTTLIATRSLEPRIRNAIKAAQSCGLVVIAIAPDGTVKVAEKATTPSNAINPADLIDMSRP